MMNQTDQKEIETILPNKQIKLLHACTNCPQKFEKNLSWLIKGPLGSFIGLKDTISLAQVSTSSKTIMSEELNNRTRIKKVMGEKYMDFIENIVSKIDNTEIGVDKIKLVVRLYNEPHRIYVPVETPSHFPRGHKHIHIHTILGFIFNNREWINEWVETNSMVSKPSSGFVAPFNDGPNNRKVLYLIRNN